MNLEEAKANIGKEVVLDESTMPYTTFSGKYDIETCFEMSQQKTYKLVSLKNEEAIISIQLGSDTLDYFVNIKHLKLKDKQLKKYKIKLTPETSTEVQELLFELGYAWPSSGKSVKNLSAKHIFAYSDGRLGYSYDKIYFNGCEGKEITLSQLRDLVVLKRNNVSDATHISEDGEMYHIANDIFVWQDEKWAQSSVLTPELKPIKEAEPQMTWEDAVRAVLDGKDVEAEGFNSIREWLELNIGTAKDFRLKPETIELNGEFTKEELLKIVGEME